MTSGKKFIDKHLALYNKLAKAADFNDDGDESDDDNVQLFAKIHAMSLASPAASGNIVATLTVHGDLEQNDVFEVYEDGVQIAQGGVTTANVDGIPGIDDDITVTWAANGDDGDEVSVKIILQRTKSEISGTVTVDG